MEETRAIYFVRQSHRRGRLGVGVHIGVKHEIFSLLVILD